MGSKSIVSVTLFLSLNLSLFSLVSSNILAPAPLTPSPLECSKLDLCLNILNLGEKLHTGNECCSILGGLVEANATLCICDQVRTRIIGIPITLDIVLELIADLCQQDKTFICN
ncbi:hypothetical protein VNO80_29197 [Phaseolus coccineus]|uniref:Hydrophobic seed protein domain-containing protein n=1 Tax=Phaseolus coccineus TaxID=3886 RepID=A0AAN9LAF6_PHACN